MKTECKSIWNLHSTPCRLGFRSVCFIGNLSYPAEITRFVRTNYNSSYEVNQLDPLACAIYYFNIQTKGSHKIFISKKLQEKGQKMA